MIRNQWYAVLESKEVSQMPVGVTRMGEKLIQGDLPIIEYRCKRVDLQHSAMQLESSL